MNGAQGRDRTTDTAIFSRMLYQLSYLGVAPRHSKRHDRGESAVYREARLPCPATAPFSPVSKGSVQSALNA